MRHDPTQRLPERSIFEPTPLYCCSPFPRPGPSPQYRPPITTAHGDLRQCVVFLQTKLRHPKIQTCLRHPCPGKRCPHAPNHINSAICHPRTHPSTLTPAQTQTHERIPTLTSALMQAHAPKLTPTRPFAHPPPLAPTPLDVRVTCLVGTAGKALRCLFYSLRAAKPINPHWNLERHEATCIGA